MRIVASIYMVDSGLLTGRTYCGPEQHLTLGDGEAWVAGLHDHMSRRVDLATGKVIDYWPPKPADTAFETHSLDAESRRWVATPTIAAHWRNVRAERDRRLSACDWVVARASERGEPVPLDWTVYRQALRDITDQPDPLAIRWPEPPA